jgi:hypothetical protein
LSISSVGSPTNGTVAYNGSTQTITFTPAASYTGTGSFVFTVSNGFGGTASATATLTVAPSGETTVTLFNPTDAPSTVTFNDGSAVELGVKFQSSAACQAIGIRFYKGPQNTDAHVANLWSAAGVLLASVTFSG